jgi:CDP-diacylglycerol--glycerol-3-phosphate 3-phosphatidyltransferase
LTETDKTAKRSLYVIVIARIFLTPAFFYVFVLGFIEAAILLYLTAFASDIVDGFLARKGSAVSSSPLEAYLDPVADFVLVLTSFYAFTLKEFYPFWILLAIALVFLFFIASSNKRGPVYDPVGKYYGTFLMTTIGITLLFPIELVFGYVLLFISLYSLGLVIYRSIYLWKNRKGNELPEPMP